MAESSKSDLTNSWSIDEAGATPAAATTSALSLQLLMSNAGGRRARAELLTIGILITTEHSSIQALTEFHFRFGADR